MLKRIGLGFFFLVLVSCHPQGRKNIRDYVDQALFRTFGITFFIPSQELTIKEVLLESGAFLEQQVVIEGNILEIGNLSTYIVLQDLGSKLLISSTGVRDIDLAKEGLRVRVLGILENGKRGLPLLRAKEIRAM